MEFRFPSYRTSKSSLVSLLFLGHSGFPPGSPPPVLLRLLHDRTPVCHLVSDYSYILTRSSTSPPYIKARAVPTVPQFEYLVVPCISSLNSFAPLARTSRYLIGVPSVLCRKYKGINYIAYIRALLIASPSLTIRSGAPLGLPVSSLTASQSTDCNRRASGIPERQKRIYPRG